MNTYCFVILKNDGFGRVDVTRTAFTRAELAMEYCHKNNPPPGQAPYYEFKRVEINDEIGNGVTDEV